VIQVREIRVNHDTGDIALYAPNGHPVQHAPWLVIRPTAATPFEGTDWWPTEYVTNWAHVPLEEVDRG
jgi:hypothetical protein